MIRISKILLVALALGACTSNKILNIDNAPVMGLAAQQHDVGQVIERALGTRGWVVEARRPGEIDARILVREHSAAITVSYTQESYSIRYRSSENLEARGGNIHRNYNRWVANLNNDIQLALAAP